MRRPNSGSGEMPESITATPMPRPPSRMSEAMPSVRRSAAPAVAGIGVASASTGASIETDSTSSRSAIASRSVGAKIRRQRRDRVVVVFDVRLACGAALRGPMRPHPHADARSRACDDRLCPPRPRVRSRACARTAASPPKDAPTRSRSRSPRAPRHEQTSIPKPTCPEIRQPERQRHSGWHTPNSMRDDAHNVAPMLTTVPTDS